MPTKLSDITIANVKAYYGETGTTYDARLTLILPLVIDMVKEYCRHDFESAVRTAEKPYIGISQYQFYTRYRPILRSPAPIVIENGVTLVLNTDYAINYDIGKIERLSASQNIFAEGLYGAWTTTPDGISITYTGGEALKQDVTLVFYELCGIYSYLKTKTYVNNQGVEASVTISSVPAELLAVLDRHQWSRI